MSLKKFQSLFIVLMAAGLGLVLHKIVIYFLVPKVYEDGFIYSIPTLYLFFTISSVIIIVLLSVVKEKSIDNVGFTYLLLTCVKMVFAYIFMLPILALNMAKTPTEKMNFFMVFIYFLAIETIVTIRILNNKQ